MKKTAIIILPAALMVLVLSCEKVKTVFVSDPPSSEYTMKVNHYRPACMGESEQLCFSIQSEEEGNMGSSSWGLLYEDIMGLDYEPGYIYTIRVRASKIQEEHTSGETRMYEMLKQISKEKVAEETEFDIFLKFDRTMVFVTGDCDAGLSLVGSVPITREASVDCGQLESDLADDAVLSITGTFVHDTETAGAIKLLSYTTTTE